jgi:hypothetical protein
VGITFRSLGGGGGSIPNQDTANCQFVYVVFISVGKSLVIGQFKYKV